MMNSATDMMRSLLPWEARRFLLEARASVRREWNRKIWDRELVKSIWIDFWEDYFKFFSVEQKTAALRSGLDQISCSYVDRTIALYKRYLIGGKCPYFLPLNEAWCHNDLAEQAMYMENKAHVRKSIHSYKNSAFFDPYLFFSRYGMRDLLDAMRCDLSKKVIMDVGAFNGDTACMFWEVFGPQQILSYEPNREAYDQLCRFVSSNRLEGKIIPVRKGMGDCEKQAFSSGMELKDTAQASSGTVSIGTIDDEVRVHRLDVGLIKMDIEGFETQAIEGAMATIKEQKPILCICIYHRARDFFDVKPYLEKLDLGYRFAIRRSEMATPLADLVLIAY